MDLLRRLGILPEKQNKKNDREDVLDTITQMQRVYPQMHHQDIPEELTKPIDLEREAKRRAIGKGDLMVLIRDFDRIQLKKGIKKMTIPENDPKSHFRGDIERA